MNAQDGETVAARIIEWSPTSVVARVPESAVTGALSLTTATGRVVSIPGVVTLPGPNGVDRLLLRRRLSMPIGTPARLRIRAQDRGRPARGKRIVLFDGVRTWSAHTDRAGVATFVVRPSLTDSLVVVSGSAWHTVRLNWVSPPVATIKLAVRARRRHRVQILASVRGTRAPAARAPITFALTDARGASTRVRRTTSRNGRASVTFAIPRGRATVTATSYATSASLKL
jgi:hypothetical protein